MTTIKHLLDKDGKVVVRFHRILIGQARIISYNISYESVKEEKMNILDLINMPVNKLIIFYIKDVIKVKKE